MNIKTLWMAAVTALMMSSCAPTINIAYQIPADFDKVYVSESTNSSASKVMGMDVDNNTSTNMTYRMTHVGQNDAGEDRFQVTYNSIVHEQQVMDQKTIYDSENPERTTDPNLEKVYGAMVDQSFVITFDDKGKITGAEGLDEMMSGVFSAVPEEARAMLESQMGGDAMLQAMKGMTNYYPEVAKKKVGDSWKTSDDVAVAGMKLLLDNTYTLVEVKDGRAKIEVTGEIATDPEAPGMEMPGVKMKFDLQGTQTGFLYIDAATSWLQRMELGQNMDGNVAMTMDQAGGMEMDMDMKIETLQTIEVKE